MAAGFQIVNQWKKYRKRMVCNNDALSAARRKEKRSSDAALATTCLSYRSPAAQYTVIDEKRIRLGCLN